jgi:hypothetical protein
MLLFDPRAADMPQRLAGSRQALLNRVLETLRRRHADLTDFGD